MNWSKHHSPSKLTHRWIRYIYCICLCGTSNSRTPWELHSSWGKTSVSTVEVERPCYLLVIRRVIPPERSIWANREKEFVLASFICFWTPELLFQNLALRLKFLMKVVSGRVLQVPGPNFISQEGLVCLFVCCYNKQPSPVSIPKAAKVYV